MVRGRPKGIRGTGQVDARQRQTHYPFLSTERGSEAIPYPPDGQTPSGPPSSVMNSTPWADAV